jgi:hypothetical protein
MTKRRRTYAVSGVVRARGESDSALVRLCSDDNIVHGFIPTVKDGVKA